MIPVLTPEQSSAWDASAQSAGISVEALMESAGRGAAAVITARLPDALRQGVLIAAGAGHNGGDGWVVARALHALGVSVWVASVGARRRPLTEAMAARALASGVREVAPDGPWPRTGLIIDAILGTGSKGVSRDEVGRLIGRLHDLEVPIVAIDGPTGLDLADGVGAGPLRALLTITFGGYRRGHLLARDEVGDLVVIDIGLPPPPAEWPRLLTDLDAAEHLMPFPSGSHKGTRGRVVVIGGDIGMVGAARLAARSAFEAGAGLVHLVAPAESLAAIGESEPDLQTLAHSFDAPADEHLRDLLSKATAVVLGPGLGRQAGRTGWVAEVGSLGAGPLLIDADGLIALQHDPGLLSRLARSRPVVITPHAGEFRALFPALSSGSAVDPWTAATEAAERSGATVLLKGVPTVVSRPGRAPLTTAAGNPGLATGGSGDTLSGIIGAFLAQGLAPEVAAVLGAQALGDAADLAARRTTARSMRPMDVIAALPDVWRRWDLLRRSPPAAFAPVLHQLQAPIGAP